ncbi:hypothetical protein [Paenibacillus piscarius]|uniref:hypothetical protein n=1 Tax=Paenibacillus piscarius TaxID=1089681 RepID=UPI001EE999EF|nr:hypothetical protein [Paenibacillus piscarius]
MHPIFNGLLISAVSIFKREKTLVMLGLLGFAIAGYAAVIMFFQGAVVLPEGNIQNVFSFAAALGIFLLSIAAIFPLAGFTTRMRKVVRRLNIVAASYSYAIETLQNFRGFNPRFSKAGSLVDTLAGALFGVLSLSFVIGGILLAVQFLKMKAPLSRPILITGIRYALLSVFIANLAGLMMMSLQGRFTTAGGNYIVLHGIGFHSLQTLLLPAWLLEHSNYRQDRQRLLLHTGCIAWLMAILLIAVQTGLGRSMFEVDLFPMLASLCLLVWLLTAISALMCAFKIRCKD